MKKRAKVKYQNDRGITPLNVAYEILTTHITIRLTVELNSITREYQSELREERFTMDQIYSLNGLQVETTNIINQLHHLLILK